MNLNKADIEELNQLLKNPKIELPSFRREVTLTGGNYEWLQKRIQLKNKGLDPRILHLLSLNVR